MKNYLILTSLAVFAFMVDSISYATTVKPLSGGKPSTIPVLSDPPPGGSKGIVLETRCYGTNNRSTKNPLSPAANSHLYMVISAGESPGYIVKFPSILAKRQGATEARATGCGYKEITPEQARGDYNSLRALFRGTFTTTNVHCGVNHMAVNINSLSIAEADKHKLKIKTYQDFNDTAHDVKRAYYGYNGLMGAGSKAKVNYVSKRDDQGNIKTLLHITSSYAGQDGYCGGFHSPLMLFFDSNRPQFRGASSLLITGSNEKTYWVEKNHAGYFLARLGVNRSKGVHVPEQLFGDNGRDEDGKRLGGFTKLAEFDSNQDGQISSSDNVWGSLVLWKDKNGDGKSQEGELVSLEKMQVTSIQLKHDGTFRYDYGKRAAAWGKGSFKYGNGSEGTVLDIYFNEHSK